MRFDISHSIRYSYSAPVFIEPMTVRLRPRCNWSQQLEEFELHVTPDPAGMSHHLDIDSNNATTLWCNGLHRSLDIDARSVVLVPPADPFKYVVTDEGALRLPVTYGSSYSRFLEPYCTPLHRSSLLKEFIDPVLRRSKQETTSFLVDLAVETHEHLDNEPRETGGPMTPDETLALGKGACRDLAVLYMEACRSLGLAARFVSGYGYSEDVDPLGKRHTHAWAEVYLPGAGWRGFDPSIGLAVEGQHVAVAAAADPANAAPMSGTFRGSGVQSTIEYNVSIRCQP